MALKRTFNVREQSPLETCFSRIVLTWSPSPSIIQNGIQFIESVFFSSSKTNEFRMKKKQKQQQRLDLVFVIEHTEKNIEAVFVTNVLDNMLVESHIKHTLFSHLARRKQ